MRSWRARIILTLLLVVVGTFSLQRYFASRSQLPENTTVKRQNLEEKLTLSGKIAADQDVVLRFQTGGLLSWVGVKEGDLVTTNQAVASLDSRVLYKTLQKYLNTYKKSRNAFEDDKDIYKDKVLTDIIKRTFENSQADLNSSVTDVEIQNIALSLATLYSPISGLVTRVTSPIAGVNITLPTQAEFEVVNPSTVYFSATADQTEVTKLYSGQTGDLVLDPFPDQTFSGTISDISFAPKEGETGTVYTLKFLVPADNSTYRFRLGMTGDLSLITAKKENVLVIPLKFVKTDQGKKYVWVKKSEKFTKQFVDTGLETENLIELRSGLSEGDTIFASDK